MDSQRQATKQMFHAEFLKMDDGGNDMPEIRIVSVFSQTILVLVGIPWLESCLVLN